MSELASAKMIIDAGSLDNIASTGLAGGSVRAAALLSFEVRGL